MALTERVAARFKSKKTLDTGNVVYEYSPRQVALRNSQKAERLEKLRKSIGRLRSQVKRDLHSEDPDKALTALAVALIDETYERVGNDQSASGKRTEDGEAHFGVTGWQRSHISFGRNRATIQYVGKSGVKQKKTVSDKSILQALRNAYEAAEDEGSLFQHPTGKVDASKVNAYLKRFDITAKDLRGFHANREMQERLRAARKGALPEDPKERKAQLKKEWDQALEETAEAVGHEASTLKSQYLVPDIEAMFLKDGTVLDKMKAASTVLILKVAARYSRFHMNSIVKKVAARYRQALEFPSPEALKQYLREHPKADPRKHSVRPSPGGSSSTPQYKPDKEVSKAIDELGSVAKDHPFIKKLKSRIDEDRPIKKHNIDQALEVVRNLAEQDDTSAADKAKLKKLHKVLKTYAAQS